MGPVRMGILQRRLRRGSLRAISWHTYAVLHRIRSRVDTNKGDDRMKIICIAGRKRSGKSTLARGLAGRTRDTFGTDNVQILPLAAPLKQAAEVWRVVPLKA